MSGHREPRASMHLAPGARVYRDSGTSARRLHAGFTLLELLIAVSLMAVLAVLGWRGLDSVLTTRDRIVQASDDLRALSAAFSQMDEDLRRSWPVRLLNLPVASLGFVPEGTDGAPGMELLRELPAGSAAMPVQRVVYRVRDGVLERGFAAWAMPSADGGGTSSVRPMTWQALIGDVRDMQIRGWIAGQGWVPAAALLRRPGAAPAAGVVTGIEVFVERLNGERVVRVFAVKD